VGPGLLVRWAGRAVGLAWTSALVLGGCGSDDAGDGPLREDDGKPPPADDTNGTGGGTGGGTGDGFQPSENATNLCGQAPTIGAGRHYGSMRGNASELAGACGEGGPDAFFRLEVPRRSDVWLRGYGASFTPRIGVLPNTCTTDWLERTLACTQGVGTWLLDVPGGSSLVISVGIESDHPSLEEPLPAEGGDPLAFAIDVDLRNVLGEGDPCVPAGRGRCGAGTACLEPEPADDPTAPPGEAVCTALPGDTCGSAVEVEVPMEGVAVRIDPAAPQTDAHVHSCGGGRMRERVLRLRLPTDPARAQAQSLRIEADDPAVGLALRAPGCGVDHERACAAPGAGAPLVVELSGSEAFLFVELPEPGDDAGGTTDGGDTGEEAPIVVTIEVLDAPAGE